jgi:hypothetical protein
MSFTGDSVAMGFGYFEDETVSPQQLQLATDA